ncbi:hypothetical protein phiPsa374_123 [Pseudomonas phage phiPsa374]|uniref:dATP/dGTP diphosphohydrolase N-terminal domain-containing protein n=2 Tax=Otagovirus TaxID=2560197 RepID=A0A7G9V1A7_9CAUD|nr:hypothetical protein CF96_gp097 [Pseudomonas phage phiPsa374]YP_010767914.1 hypothetical protein QGX20_gp094 [Pseudomonas phage phiPsa300]AHJ87383.1 hypothetical protein phiPsa374_123 [Pseudomonas phage phiPsa374]QNO00063.1 hypothetical protein phiPsa300_128 [Pseudomonas phage phiPsa300]
MRILTIDEMMDQAEGEQAVLARQWGKYPVGTQLVRRKAYRDDLASVAYFFDGGKSFEFFEEGEVGVVEEVATNTICAGRVCTDFSAHMELFQPEPSLTIKTLAEIMPQDRDEAAKLFADLVPPGEDVELGVFRPKLETRKIGKIRVELVDEGFPLALREVAHVMTWAQTAKGYKDHDWQNLPDAEVALAAAASRHRTDHIKQRVVDRLDIDQCVDVESGLLHKAHEAFGVLAQLELMLRGKFVDSRPQVGV